MSTTVKVASFMEAFKKFLSYTDGSLSVETLASFAELKKSKKIVFNNEDHYWCGNHHSSSSSVELLLVEEPCLFFVVRYNYCEISDNPNTRTETTVFVPELNNY